MCGPTVRPRTFAGEVQAAKSAVSSLHSKVEPDSLAENLNSAVFACVTAGGLSVIVVSGGVVSFGWLVTVHVQSAGL